MTRADRVLVAVVVSVVLIVMAIVLLRTGILGWTIFVVLPAFAGGIVSWVLRPANAENAAATGALAAVASTGLLLLLGLEGIVCIVMAVPLAMPLGALGGWIAYFAESSILKLRNSVMILLLLPVATVSWDLNARSPVFKVQTAIEVSAAPERVWKHVIEFSELPPPQDWVFRTGIAYPKQARIDGRGRGAVRYCEFSTGPFVEPIKIWDEPRLLRFGVTKNPAPIEEWSPYGQIVTKHLHGYLISKQGQFRLQRLPNGRTLLEGTTWYQHGLWPAAYWRWWSDAIIHRVHLRVLNHVRMLAEQGANHSW
jgi:hypothetical protein